LNLIQIIKQRGLLWVTVHALLFALDRSIEFYLYPVSIIGLGLVYGTGVMMLLSLVLCLLLIWLYDWVSTSHEELPAWHPVWAKRIERAILPHLKDALGFETLKEVMGETVSVILEPELPKIQNGWRRVFSILTYAFRIASYAVRRFLVRPVWIRFPKSRRFLLFLYLSLAHDPMTCMILMRPAHHHSMGRKEWTVFLSSVIVSCGSWALLVWLGIESYSELFA
jgi:hypothetical protein